MSRRSVLFQAIGMKTSTEKGNSMKTKFALLALCLTISSSFAADRFTGRVIDCPPDGVKSKCYDTIRFGSQPVIALTADDQSALAFEISSANRGALGTLESAFHSATLPSASMICKFLGYTQAISYSANSHDYAVSAIRLQYVDGVLQDLRPEYFFEIQWSDGSSYMTLRPQTFDRVRCQ